MTKRRLLFALVALAATTTLSACALGPVGTTPTPTPTSSSGASPTPTPDPTPEPVAASVAFSAEAIMVLDAAGAPLASFDYFQPTAEVVAGLSEYLGAPVDSPNPGGIETPPGVDHVWNDLLLFDTDPAGSPPDIPNHYVFVSGPSAGSLPVSTADGVGSEGGVSVGDAATSMTIGVEAGVPHTDPATGRTSIASRIGIVPLPSSPAGSDPRNFGVMVVSYTDTGAIERLVAPSANFGV